MARHPTLNPAQVNSRNPSAVSLGGVEVRKDLILKTAAETGFLKRKPRKIHAHDFLLAVCQEAVDRSPSFNDLAARMEASECHAASRQAVWKKMGEPCRLFFQKILEHVILSKIAQMAPDDSLGRYRRVLVQDSTVIKLPARLFPIFSGVSNGRSEPVCNARVQVVYDLVSKRFLSFSIDPYSKNDLASAPELELREDDLTLRDRGYLTNIEIQRHLAAKADCVYRHKTGAIYFDKKGKAINLPALLRRHGVLDMPAFLNNESRTPIRIVAAPVDKETANLRRMRAKTEMRGHAPSQAVLELMDWTIFITTIPETKVTFAELLAIYGLRWRIEVIFKSWKSHFKFEAIHRVSENQLRVILTARLIMIVAYANGLFRNCASLIRENHGRELSYLKFTNYLAKTPEMADRLAAAILNPAGHGGNILAVVARYCVYDKRKRPNFSQNLMAAKLG